MTQEVWYRYEDIVHAYYDRHLATRFGVNVEVVCREYRVVRHTPRGVWLEVPNGSKRGERFVLNDSYKRFAYAKKGEAKKSFLLRKTRQLHILKGQLQRAEESINVIKRMMR
jgi:hypothetical protein